MKNLLIFLFGVAFGTGGTLLWLRKDIKKQLKEIEEQSGKNVDDDVPFTVGEKKEKETHVPVAVRPETRVEYNKIIHENYVDPVETREDDNEDPNEGLLVPDETNGAVYEIDDEEYMHNHEYSKEQLIYYHGDRIMCTEEGTKIEKPFVLVGGEWENCVGNYAKKTAFIRNAKLATDYEIYVEDGLYSEEYGPD